MLANIPPSYNSFIQISGFILAETRMVLIILRRLLTVNGHVELTQYQVNAIGDGQLPILSTSKQQPHGVALRIDHQKRT